MKSKPTIAEIVSKQIEDMIADGILQEGVQLPSERVLAERLEVSRPTLREAKQILTSKGLLKSQQGGGTYVTSALNSSISDPLMNLLKERPEFKFDILELRHTLDSEAAFFSSPPHDGVCAERLSSSQVRCTQRQCDAGNKCAPVI